MGLFKKRKVKQDADVMEVLESILQSGIPDIVKAGHVRQITVRGLDNFGEIDLVAIQEKYNDYEIYGEHVCFEYLTIDGGIRFTW